MLCGERKSNGKGPSRMDESKAARRNAAIPIRSPRPEVRTEKIRVVRRQLLEGKYDMNERLDVILERILQDLTSQN